jgi:hypothetical protein
MTSPPFRLLGGAAGAGAKLAKREVSTKVRVDDVFVPGGQRELSGAQVRPSSDVRNTSTGLDNGNLSLTS